jgi:hypothetical protein
MSNQLIAAYFYLFGAGYSAIGAAFNWHQKDWYWFGMYVFLGLMNIGFICANIAGFIPYS